MIFNRSNAFWALLLICVSFTAAACASNDDPVIVYQKTYDFFGLRDVAYSGKITGQMGGQYVVVGPTTQQTSTGTGTDFFALSVNKNNGNRQPQFGQNGLVTIDFDNVNGTSRTDVATELLVLNHPNRIAVLGESVTSKTGPVNLTFSLAMLDGNNGALVQSFGNGGKVLSDVELGNNDEIMFGDVDSQNNMIVGGFANPVTQVGPNPPFNCALVKFFGHNGKRDTSFGQNGQVIIDFNGNDDRCRAGIATKDHRGIFTGYMVGGRTKPAPIVGVNATDNQNNWRFSATIVDANGDFVPDFTDGIHGYGRVSLNMNNGSYHAIRSVQIMNYVYTIGNWGGWDNGVSGNQGIALLKWNRAHGIDTSYRGVVYPPVSGGSYDIYGLAYDGGLYIYASGSIKSNAAASSLPQAVIIRFLWTSGKLDTRFGNGGIYRLPLPNGFIGSNLRSVVMDGMKNLMLTGEAIKSPGTNADADVLIARVRV